MAPSTTGQTVFKETMNEDIKVGVAPKINVKSDGSQGREFEAALLAEMQKSREEEMEFRAAQLAQMQKEEDSEEKNEGKAGINFALFIIFLGAHLVDINNVRFGTFGLTWGVLFWLLLMPMCGAFLLEERTKSFIDRWKPYWFWGALAVVIPLFEPPLSAIFERLGQGALGVNGGGAVLATLIVYCPFGLFPFIFGKYVGRLLKIRVLGEFTNPQFLTILYIFIVGYSFLFIATDKFQPVIQETNVWLAEQFGYDVNQAVAERATIPLFSLVTQSVTTAVRTTYGNLVYEVSGAREKAIKLATGDFYTGKVDEKAKQKIGVYLDPLQSTEKQFFTDQPAIFFTRLKAEVLDAAINITLSCTATKKDQIINSTRILPRDFFDVATFEEESLDCIFDEGTLTAGDYGINMSADFNFKTLAYVKTYFMDKERLRAYKSEGIDPFKEQGIKDTKPGAIYTGGPVMVGLGLNRDPPISVDRELTEQTYTLGISVKNQWHGAIKKIEKIIIMLPKGFEVNAEIPSGLEINKKTCKYIQEEGCDDEISNVYELTPAKGQEISTEHNFRIYLKVNEADYDLVLGTTPMITHYFKAGIEYKYQLAQIKRIKILQPASAQETQGGSQTRTEAPIITAYEAKSVAQTTATITWTTDRNSAGFVEYWEASNPSLIFEAESMHAEIEHNILIIEGLAPGRSYVFRINLVDDTNNGMIIRKSAPKTFKTKK